MYYRNKENQRRLKKVSEEKLRHYPAGAYYDKKKQRYVKCNKGKGYTQNKRIGNRKIRRLVKSGKPYNKNYYDLWWNTY